MTWPWRLVWTFRLQRQNRPQPGPPFHRRLSHRLLSLLRSRRMTVLAIAWRRRVRGTTGRNTTGRSAKAAIGEEGATIGEDAVAVAGGGADASEDTATNRRGGAAVTPFAPTVNGRAILPRVVGHRLPTSRTLSSSRTSTRTSKVVASRAKVRGPLRLRPEIAWPKAPETGRVAVVDDDAVADVRAKRLRANSTAIVCRPTLMNRRVAATDSIPSSTRMNPLMQYPTWIGRAQPKAVTSSVHADGGAAAAGDDGVASEAHVNPQAALPRNRARIRTTSRTAKNRM